MSCCQKIMKGVVLFLFVLSGLLWLTGSGQTRAEHPAQKKATPQEWNELTNRIGSIQREIAELKNHEWAGIYKLGYWASGSVLYVAPKSGFVDQPHVDYYPNEFIDQFDYGEIKVANGRYFIHSLRGNFGSDEIFFLRWGDRRFLVPSDNLGRFINQVNAGCDQFQTKTEVLRICCYVKEGDERRALSGVPDLPAQFASLILKNPIAGQITSVSDTSVENPAAKYVNYPWRWRSTNVTLNLGKTRGVWPGMLMFIDSSLDSMQVRVTDVSDDAANAIVLASVNINEKEPPLPSIGWRVTSRLKNKSQDEVCW